MFDLTTGKSKETRVAWLVLCDNQHLYLTRSGNGTKFLNKVYKKTKYTSTAVDLNMFNNLKGYVVYMEDITKGNQLTLL